MEDTRFEFSVSSILMDALLFWGIFTWMFWGEEIELRFQILLGLFFFSIPLLIFYQKNPPKYVVFEDHEIIFGFANPLHPPNKQRFAYEDLCFSYEKVMVGRLSWAFVLRVYQKEGEDGLLFRLTPASFSGWSDEKIKNIVNHLKMKNVAEVEFID